MPSPQSGSAEPVRPAERPAGLVTGGGRGIGLGIAEAWARRGVAVAAVDSDPDGAERLRAACASHAAPHAFYDADVRDHRRAREVVEDAIHRFGRLDYLVCNAGITRDRVLWKMDEAEWDEVIAVNLKGAFNYVRAAAPHLIERRAGRVVFISSINGLRGKFGQTNYAASKAGLIGFARALALEMGPRGVTVNVVAPGFVRTAMTGSLPADVIERAGAESALKRVAEVEDIARAVEFLCTDGGRHVTGVVLRVDGGQAMAAESA
jgi:NAD(P)-dependent dehydrogenase (short-subunit alcohol dehydrogenase family)